MSRRGRAILLGLAAVAAAALAASAAGGYAREAADAYGPLADVAVAQRPIRAGARFDDQRIESLGIRRVPERFIPTDAIRAVDAVAGLRTRAPLPEGAYVLASQLRAARRDQPRPTADHRRGKTAVQVAVTGVDEALISGPVDVVAVRAASGGRARVVAENLRVLGSQSVPEPGGAADARVTLEARRPQALQLIAAEAEAGAVRLIPSSVR